MVIESFLHGRTSAEAAEGVSIRGLKMDSTDRSKSILVRFRTRLSSSPRRIASSGSRRDFACRPASMNGGVMRDLAGEDLGDADFSGKGRALRAREVCGEAPC